MNSGFRIAVDEKYFSEILSPISVKYMNLKRETPLHLAAKKEDVKVKILHDLATTGSDINAQNKWRQTPLHYAAIGRCVQNMEILLRVPGVDVNQKDVNGYNALHSFIYHDYYTRISDEESFHDQNFLYGMKLLLGSGIDINDQTKFGYTILHMAAARIDNHSALLNILQNFPNANITKLNKFGENFLHIYAKSGIFKNILDLIKTIGTHTALAQELLNQRNVNGKTPWSLMVDSSNMSEDDFNSLLHFEIAGSVLDNLGNNVLHTKLNNTYFDFILKYNLMNEQHINSKNIFGQSCVFTLYMEPVLDLLLQSNVVFHTKDRWGRTPFMCIMTCRPRPELLQKMIKHGQADVNARDCYGSTPLHIAAYFNYEEQVKLLMSHGADVNSVDALEDKPIDTVKRHCSFRCAGILQKAGVVRKTVDRLAKALNFGNKSIGDILLKMPKTILSSTIESKDPMVIRKILGLPQNMREFSTCILKEKYLQNPVYMSEVEDITTSVKSLVETVCKTISDYDPRFHMYIYPTGSSAEGTKVGPPDEFDFALCLTQLEYWYEIRETIACRDESYACLSIKDFLNISEEFLPFSDSSGYFLAFPYFQYLARYVHQALNEAKLWKNGNIYYNAEKPLGLISGKPVFNFEIYWIGLFFKQLKISIDLVPVVYKKGWWPKNTKLKDMPLVNEHVISAGCFLMLQTENDRFYKKFTWDTTNDAIVDTCDTDHTSDCWGHRKLRVSSAPAEICLMRLLPEQFRHAYALAKIFVSEVVCPDIEIDMISDTRCMIRSEFRLERSHPFKPGRFIKSYMLKNCVFQITQDLRSTETELNGILDITTMLFTRLLKMSDDYNFVPYFLPLSDVFQFEKEEKRSTYTDYMLKLKRQLSIKLVLGMLNHRQD